jgi:hypothetical protein
MAMNSRVINTLVFLQILCVKRIVRFSPHKHSDWLGHRKYFIHTRLWPIWILSDGNRLHRVRDVSKCVRITGKSGEIRIRNFLTKVHNVKLRTLQSGKNPYRHASVFSATFLQSDKLTMILFSHCYKTPLSAAKEEPTGIRSLWQPALASSKAQSSLLSNCIEQISTVPPREICADKRWQKLMQATFCPWWSHQIETELRITLC